MQVVVLLLLVAGLALLVLGLITGNTGLVLASIAASLLAAVTILRYRRRLADGPSSRPAADDRDDLARVPALASVSAEPAQAVVVPPAHAAAEPAHAEDGDPPDDQDDEPPAADTDPPLRSRGDKPVWVIDGRPRYHLPGCAFLLHRGPEPVPLRQAVEDGFSPCALCDPDSGLADGLS